MPGSKSFFVSGSTGATVYAIVKRLADGFLLNDATGSFAAAPADPYVSLTEDGTLKGLYALAESRAAWANGLHRIAFYKQVGGAPAPATDAPPLSVLDVAVLGDAVFDPYQLAAGVAGSRAFILRSIKAQKSTDDTVAGLASQVKITNSQAVSMDKGQRRAEGT